MLCICRTDYVFCFDEKMAKFFLLLMESIYVTDGSDRTSSVPSSVFLLKVDKG